MAVSSAGAAGAAARARGLPAVTGGAEREDQQTAKNVHPVRGPPLFCEAIFYLLYFYQVKIFSIAFKN